MLAFIHSNFIWDFDHFRHWLAYAFNPVNWITNGSEQIVAIGLGAVISYIIWPKFHRVVDGWVKGHFENHRAENKKMLDQHHKALKAHIAHEIAKLSAKEKP